MHWRRSLIRAKISGGPYFRVGFYATYNTIWQRPALGYDAELDTSVLFFGSVDNSVYAIDAGSGRALWRFATLGPVYGSPLLTTDGMVLVGSTDGNLYALESSDGSLVWSFRANYSITNSPRLLPATGNASGSSPSVVFSTDAVNTDKFRDGLRLRGADLNNAFTLFALDLNGDLVWRRRMDDMVATPAVRSRDGMLFVPSASSLVVALRETAALQLEEVWRFRAGPRTDQSCCGPNIYRAPVLSSDGNTLFFGAYDNFLYALDANTGLLLWKTEMPYWVTESPAVGEDGTVYATSADMKLRAFDPRTGRIRWAASTGPHLPTGPVIGHTDRARTTTSKANDAGGTQSSTPSSPTTSPPPPQEIIYVGTREAINDNLFAYSTNGTLLWTAATGGDYGIGVTAVVADPRHSDVVYVAVGDDVGCVDRITPNPLAPSDAAAASANLAARAGPARLTRNQERWEHAQLARTLAGLREWSSQNASATHYREVLAWRLHHTRESPFPYQLPSLVRWPSSTFGGLPFNKTSQWRAYWNASATYNWSLDWNYSHTRTYSRNVSRTLNYTVNWTRGFARRFFRRYRCEYFYRGKNRSKLQLDIDDVCPEARDNSSIKVLNKRRTGS